MVFEVPTAYLCEYAKAMDAQFGVNLSESWISQFLKDHDISRKKVHNLPFSMNHANFSLPKKQRNEIRHFVPVGS
jgi:transposase